MIAHLSGTVTAIGISSVVIDLGGVGLEAQCTPHTAAELRLGQPARLSTSLVVREDSLTLFGFADDDERDVFVLLQTASGVGPRIAQAALAVLRPDEVRAAIVGEDLSTLTRVPGIGRKGAQRIVLELKDKVNALAAVTDLAERRPAGAAAWRQQVGDGLQGLGWTAREAELACDRVAPMIDDDPATPIATLMRAALQSMAK